MRLKQPRVPITNGRALRIPKCWTERIFDLQIFSAEQLENLNEFALYEISRYYPLISIDIHWYGEEIVILPGLTMYYRVKWRWIEEILQNSKRTIEFHIERN